MKRARKILARAAIGIWLMAVVVVVGLNLRLYCSSPLATNDEQRPPALSFQLAANRDALDNGAASQMQKFFPEGYYFCYLLHGLTWVELAMRDEAFAPKAIEEANWCLSKLDSPEGCSPFPSNLPPDHGMFYSAWKCSLLAGIVRLQQGDAPAQTHLLRRECDAIAAALADSSTPFMASYNGSAWPCDTIPAIHAMVAYDQTTGENRYQGDVDRWIQRARQRIDPGTGLLPHTAGLPDGRRVGVARATSQVIMLRYLPDIDAGIAKRQYEIFRERFLTTFLGVPCLLEYPSGVSGDGDVDSGPLIFGRSLSATVMMIGVAQVYGDQSLADVIAQAGEVVGMPWTSDGKKEYAGGLLPVGNIIVAYSQVGRPWFADGTHHPSQPQTVSPRWRWPIHACSMIVLCPAIVIVISRRKNISTPEGSPDKTN